MLYRKENGKYHIEVEKGEEEKTVLTAIGKAAFRLALSTDQTVTEQPEPDAETIDRCFIRMTAEGRPKLEMDFVRLKKCKTFVAPAGPGGFVLGEVYEEEGGNAETLLEAANTILNEKASKGE